MWSNGVEFSRNLFRSFLYSWTNHASGDLMLSFPLLFTAINLTSTFWREEVFWRREILKMKEKEKTTQGGSKTLCSFWRTVIFCNLINIQTISFIIFEYSLNFFNGDWLLFVCLTLYIYVAIIIQYARFEFISQLFC